MTSRVKRLQSEGFENSCEDGHECTALVSKERLIQRLKRNPKARNRFVESHLEKSLAFQIRALRDQHNWTQSQLAEKIGIRHPNNVSARLENPNYGKHTLTTLKRIAAACDVGVVVWFVPFSRLADWSSGTPYLDPGLSPSFYEIPGFEDELREGKFEAKPKKKPIAVAARQSKSTPTQNSGQNTLKMGKT